MIDVRHALARDAGAIASIHVRSWQHAYRGILPAVVLDSLDEAARENEWRARLGAPEHDLLVAELGATVVGFCSLQPSRDADAPPQTGEVVAIYVAPEHTGRGAGSALLRACLTVSRGYRGLTLWVLAGNHAARRFYEAFGYGRDGATQRVERGGARLEQVRYRLDLPDL
ncbi:MAG TPA: GNAT family N-acetyltransferase [Polyangiaceae bacterium]|nr:GNAT family N-acetyltransferase [Polyangiaceae bacterium]